MKDVSCKGFLKKIGVQAGLLVFKVPQPVMHFNRNRIGLVSIGRTLSKYIKA